jgi:polyhydroxyalkanoate synthesis regulator phasin
LLEDIKRTVEAATKDLSAERAQRLARSLLEPGARKDQVAKVAGELMDWSQRNRDRLAAFVAREVKAQLHGMGLVTRSELDSLARRVRSLEKGGTGAARSPASRKSRSTAGSASGEAVARSGSTRKSASARKTTSKGRSASAGRRRGASAG